MVEIPETDVCRYMHAVLGQGQGLHRCTFYPVAQEHPRVTGVGGDEYPTILGADIDNTFSRGMGDYGGDLLCC